MFTLAGNLGKQGITEVTFQMQARPGIAPGTDNTIIGVATLADELDEYGKVIWQIIGNKNDLKIYISQVRAMHHARVSRIVVGGSCTLLTPTILSQDMPRPPVSLVQMLLSQPAAAAAAVASEPEFELNAMD